MLAVINGMAWLIAVAAIKASAIWTLWDKAYFSTRVQARWLMVGVSGRMSVCASCSFDLNAFCRA